jgi:hypothetical protein
VKVVQCIACRIPGGTARQLRARSIVLSLSECFVCWSCEPVVRREGGVVDILCTYYLPLIESELLHSFVLLFVGVCRARHTATRNHTAGFVDRARRSQERERNCTVPACCRSWCSKGAKEPSAGRFDEGGPRLTRHLYELVPPGNSSVVFLLFWTSILVLTPRFYFRFERFLPFICIFHGACFHGTPGGTTAVRARSTSNAISQSKGLR